MRSARHVELVDYATNPEVVPVARRAQNVPVAATAICAPRPPGALAAWPVAVAVTAAAKPTKTAKKTKIGVDKPHKKGRVVFTGQRSPTHAGDKKMTTTTTTYLCTNGANSSFWLVSTDAQTALTIAATRFDAECSYFLPISVESEDGDIASIY